MYFEENQTIPNNDHGDPRIPEILHLSLEIFQEIPDPTETQIWAITESQDR